MVSVEDARKAQRAEGPATIKAIGTSTPPNCVDQSTYPNYYFRIIKSAHMTELKEKFQRISHPSTTALSSTRITPSFHLCMTAGHSTATAFSVSTFSADPSPLA
ncbi:hypothetical protein RHSIM_Rhsim09G0036300 [Rhododendron simsii]|uniref:chalcone synthase n=1 Tax=Rhododendron simsii TaxID=118357 RepID=A0A834GHM8_RHOSS|nr:hypothetical protein RHSIM_Rhsim09G0036300 [Rhododendron simsii]